MDLRGAARGSLILLAALGCATSHSLKAIEDSKFEKVEHQEASGEKHEGPSLILEFGPMEHAGADLPSPALTPHSAGSDGKSGEAPAGHARPDGLPPHGPLLKATFTGPIDTAWQTSSDGLWGAERHAETKVEDKAAPSSGCALGLGFWLAVGLGLLAFGGWVWLKRSLP